jgi:hypothetical protein
VRNDASWSLRPETATRNKALAIPASVERTSGSPVSLPAKLTLRLAAQLGLTTVAQSLREQGAACAHAALGQKPDSHTASWSIVRRGSTRQ